MTTPDKAGSPEDLGTVEIFGANFSTFTRSILTGLHEVGIPFIQHSHVPHSQEIKKRNPFGLLPVLVHRPDGLYTSPENVVTLFESNAIRRYIDEALVPNHPSRQVLTPDLVPKQAQSARLRARVDQFVSAISMTLFPTIETGVVKPVIRMEKNGADQATISVALEENLQSMELSLGKLEQMILVNGQGQGQWVMGNIFTWADLFLYPILADLKSLPQVS
ncbi:hypothetical protein IE53DRAFT_35071 [Violaceomyces palustris]|uniref:Uncharacterized protein n=1 Tax=Violaceomyces palustris TaxID=1673888 RepID=A0ACD0P146_9BASI|nr:hypothetical protein IE53DRAFT_35071 [Violaceomyces palustris]